MKLKDQLQLQAKTVADLLTVDRQMKDRHTKERRELDNKLNPAWARLSALIDRHREIIV